MTRRHHRTCFMWWLIVGLTFAQGVFSPLVLCIGGNGHLATETTHVPSSQHGTDGVCLDAPMLSAAEKPLRSDAHWGLNLDEIKPLLTLVANLTPSGSGAASARYRPCDSFLCNPILPALRTVILLV